ncbi:GTPase of the mitochondrial inner membrane that associates with the large ribosomal subunit [Balamuthia mandrillaris]
MCAAPCPTLTHPSSLPLLTRSVVRHHRSLQQRWSFFNPPHSSASLAALSNPSPLLFFPARSLCSSSSAPSTAQDTTAPRWLPPKKEPRKTVKMSERQKRMQFIDKRYLSAIAGRGGNGAVSFFRDANVPLGPADGGNGGAGGSVIIKATSEHPNLKHVLKRYKAEHGQHGAKRHCHGRKGADVVVHVPLGTVVSRVESYVPEARRELLAEKVREMDSFETEEDLLRDEDLRKVMMTRSTLLADLEEEGQMVIVAKGGEGGRGNANYTSSTNRSPKKAKKGKEGESLRVELETKLLADIGLVGYPNAGKSSFLSAVSEARPHIASYAFTTQTPNLGIIEFDDYTQLCVADIPGIIKGAHNKEGLGLAFLRHIERTRLFCFILDIGSNAATSPQPAIAAFHNLIAEMEHYRAGFSHHPSIVLANKVDLLPASSASSSASLPQLEQLREAIGEHDPTIPVLGISAQTGQGLEQAVSMLKRMCDALARMEEEEKEARRLKFKVR